MARKKKIDSDKLISMYMDYVLEHKKKPKIEVVHRPDRFDLDIIKITHR